MADRSNFTITPALEARFWAKVDKRGPDECWPWMASKSKYGYGNIAVNRRCVRATHVALILDGRPRTGSLHALHSCDNPPCVNPSHLRWGTIKDNADDCVSRGRKAVGARNGNWTKPEKYPKGTRKWRAKLNDDLVREILQSKESSRKLSPRYGVSAPTISLIRRRKRWKHVETF